MPDDQWRLTAADNNKITLWLKENADVSCQVCRRNTWHIVEHLLDFRIYRGGGISLGGETYPVVALVCSTCGNFRFHSAVMIGIVKPFQEEKENVESAS